MHDNVFASTILLTVVQEFRHFFGTLVEAVAESIGIALFGLHVEFVLTLEVVEVPDGQLENVGFLQLGYVLFAVAL